METMRRKLCTRLRDESTTRRKTKSGRTEYSKVGRKASCPADTVRIRNQQYSLDERRNDILYATA